MDQKELSQLAQDSPNFRAESCVPWKPHQTRASQVRGSAKSRVGSKGDALKQFLTLLWEAAWLHCYVREL